VILLDDVRKSYGNAAVLRGIDLEVPGGEFLSVMGSSGSGKSTLLNLIGGMDRPDSGTVRVDGQDLTALSDEPLTLYRRRKVGFIFQFFNLLPNITVFENVQMPLLLNGRDDTARVTKCLGHVGLDDKARSYPYELSGGQQQRVAIARALVHDPPLILADEPTGSLDSSSGDAIMTLIASLCRERGRTVLLVTHDVSVARQADRVLKIRDGRILP
jgi:putative ABC transport system ATP-binding protein